VLVKFEQDELDQWSKKWRNEHSTCIKTKKILTGLATPCIETAFQNKSLKEI